MVTLDELTQMAHEANGKRRQRTVGQKEATSFLDLLREVENDSKVAAIRVYSRDGFVANSYNYRAFISVFCGERDMITGEWRVDCRTVDAKRAHGSAALITVNGRDR